MRAHDITEFIERQGWVTRVTRALEKAATEGHNIKLTYCEIEELLTDEKGQKIAAYYYCGNGKKKAKHEREIRRALLDIAGICEKVK